MSKIIKGDDLMLFDEAGKSIAFATSHSLSISGDAAEISSKDHGAWSGSEVNKISWEISSENLYTVEAFDKLFEKMTARKAVKVYFGLKTEDGAAQSVADGDLENWSKKTAGVYTGNVFITALNANASSGDNATYSVTLKGTGKLTKAQD